ncbi:MAG: ferredoxin [Clostridiales bacterium]|nr:ferredoxin [Clostridiales bacterium]
MLYNERNFENEVALTVAKKMAAAARTAPKASGLDKIEILVLDGKEKDELAAALSKAGRERNIDFFVRDAGNIEASEAVVLIGMNNIPFGLPQCGICGFRDCASMKKAGGRCSFNVTDLGIAVGSAVSIAADNRIDNRVLYSGGKIAVEAGFFEKGVCLAYAIPLSISTKSIFFDRGKNDKASGDECPKD